jgi:hypothetical protein
MFWIALAAQFTIAQPLSPVFSTDDFPAYLQDQHGSRRVFVRMVIGPDGALKDCAIETSSGDAALDQFTCGLVKKRGHFWPARWSNGRAVASVIRKPVDWVAGSQIGRDKLYEDLDVTVDRLPDGVHAPYLEGVLLAVDEAGKIVDCEHDGHSSSGMEKDDAELTPLACDQLKKNYTPLPLRDQNGRGIPSIQNAAVRFETLASKTKTAAP